ncbi:calcium-binding protein [Streptomyces sp. RerS4]|uniref:calcium-binding protein n=1 Tax=Streptomyces sp. RerS4 TaxID=2942449 RepID=UPI00201C036F|nr:calcium-binding protein [Streptomyces sp. RerS4]UQX01270.1 calcium-binding protein [Streptomyces sp. RerS4]
MPLYPPRRRSGRIGAVSAAALALVCSLAGVAMAAPGDLDPAFSGDGKVITDVTGYENIAGMVVQPDGKIVTVGDGYFDDTSGDFVLVRYNTDGSLDTSFGGDGIVTTDFDVNNEEARALALQPDGKIVAVGGSTSIAGTGAWASARYNSDGSLDTTYGDGGRALTDPDVDTIDTAEAVAVQPNGALVLGGSSFGRWTVARLTPAGGPDTSFGGDGIVITDFGGGACCGVSDLALQSDGRIVAAGSASGFALARYNADGSLDTGFDGDGRVTTGFGTSAEGVALQSDGKIVTAGAAGNAFAVMRFTANGAPDTTFDGDGRATTSFGPEYTWVADMALQSDGRIVAAGQYAGEFALARFNAGGSLDTDFSGDGRLTTDFGGVSEQATSVALQADGKILAGGVAGEANSLNADRAVARYLGGGGSEPPLPPADLLSVTKAGTTTVSIGDQATYTVTVTNTSTTTTATGVTLTDTLTGVAGTLLSVTPGPGQGSCTVTSTSANCALSSLAPGARVTVTVVAEPRATGTLSDRATASAAQSDPVPANNTATATTTVNNARGCTIIGTSGADTLTGGYFNDVICALSGNDIVRAGYGNDTVHAGPGNDNVDGGHGGDTLNGNTGNDTLTGYYGDDRLNTVDGVSGNDTANGGFGTDTCTTDPGDTRLSCP